MDIIEEMDMIKARYDSAFLPDGSAEVMVSKCNYKWIETRS